MEYMNIVRMRIKEGQFENWQARIMENMQMGPPPDGMLEVKHVRIEDNAVCVVGRWASKAQFMAARPRLVQGLDRLREFLEPYREGLGDTDPASGEVIFDSSQMMKG